MRKGSFDSASGREAGKRSAERRADLRELEEVDPERYFDTVLRRELPKLARELVAAAKGRGHWAGLSVSGRQQALFRALEYAIGKPRLLEPVEKPKPEADEGPGLIIE